MACLAKRILLNENCFNESPPKSIHKFLIEIVNLWQEKLSISEIKEMTGVAKTTFCYTLEKYKQIGTNKENNKSTGRSPKLSYQEEKRFFPVKMSSKGFK